MLLVRVLTATFEVLRSIYWYVVEIETFTSWVLAFDLATSAIEEIVVFIGMIAETFGRGADCLAHQSFWVVPTRVKPILGYLAIVFLVLLELLLRHEHSPIIANQIAVFDVFVDMLGTAAAAGRLTDLHMNI
jgi:hypothetical protein